MLPSEEKPLPGVGVYWIEEADYPALLKIFDDAATLPPAWAQWRKMAEEMEKGLKAFLSWWSRRGTAIRCYACASIRKHFPPGAPRMALRPAGRKANPLRRKRQKKKGRGGEKNMSAAFEELDYRQTPIGALSLRRRRELSLGVDVFEIKLGDEFLMSSLFTASEIALARLGLADCPPGERPSMSWSAGWGSATRRRPCWSTRRWPRSSSSRRCNR